MPALEEISFGAPVIGEGAAILCSKMTAVGIEPATAERHVYGTVGYPVDQKGVGFHTPAELASTGKGNTISVFENDSCGVRTRA